MALSGQGLGGIQWRSYQPIERKPSNGSNSLFDAYTKP